MRSWMAVLPVGLTLASGACSDATSVAPTVANQVDTVSLAALTGTPVAAPSAYALNGAVRVQTTESAQFDFAFDLRADGSSVLLPAGYLNAVPDTSLQPGLAATSLQFDQMVLAPSNGYATAAAVPVAPGDRYYVRSAIVPTCSDSLPFYAKLEVLAVDTTARRLSFRILVDQNCGHRGLEPGLPTE